MCDFIPLSVPNLQGKELNYIQDAVKSEWVSTAGSFVNKFEENICSYLKVKNAIACQSGTAGLHLSLLSLKIEKNDEIIVPTLTFIAAVNPVRYIGAFPIFIDCDDSLCIDVKKINNFINENCVFKNNILKNKLTGRKIKAILVVHVFGNMADMENLVKLAKKYNLKIIEDATEALGTRYKNGIFKNKYAGTIGDIGVFSFNGNKIITTGGGGMVVSNNEKYLKTVRFLSTQAKNDDVYFVHNEIGFNYRMTNVQAAIGVAQLEKLEYFIDIKKNNYNLYKTFGVNLVNFRENTRPNYWFYSYFTRRRDEFIEFMSKKNIQTRPIWKLIHTQKCYEKFQSYNIKKAFEFWKKIVNIPCSTNLSTFCLKKVIKVLKEFEARFSG